MSTPARRRTYCARQCNNNGHAGLTMRLNLLLTQHLRKPAPSRIWLYHCQTTRVIQQGCRTGSARIRLAATFLGAMGMRNTILLAAMSAVMLLSAAAQAQPRMEFDLGFGYSHLHLSGSDRFKNRDGARIEPRSSIAPFSELRPLRFGFGLGMSSYSHELDDDVTITIDDGDEIHIFRADQWETVSLVSPELDRKSTRLNSSHLVSRMPSSASKKNII